MDSREALYYIEYRAEQFRRDREHARLVAQARLNQPRSARIFRIFPLRKRESDITAD